jgi:hypothetical protein
VFGGAEIDRQWKRRVFQVDQRVIDSATAGASCCNFLRLCEGIRCKRQRAFTKNVQGALQCSWNEREDNESVTVSLGFFRRSNVLQDSPSVCKARTVATQAFEGACRD